METLLMELVTALGPMGFVMWLVHRTTTHTIPRLAKSFEQSVERQRVDFKEMFRDQRSDYERMMTREQDVHAAQTDKIVEAIKSVGAERCIARVRKPLDGD